MHMGWIGGLLGGLIGVAGGIVGTWFSIRNTNGPRERWFMIKGAVVTWVALAMFIAVLWLVPSPWRFFAWIPYGVLLPLGIIYSNRKQQQIRNEEADTKRLSP